MLLLIEPKSWHSWGDRSCSSAAPRIWNSLPLNLRSCLCTSNLKSLLKTYQMYRLLRTNFVVSIFLSLCFWFYCALNTQQGGYNMRITNLYYWYYDYYYNEGEGRGREFHEPLHTSQQTDPMTIRSPTTPQATTAMIITKVIGFSLITFPLVFTFSARNDAGSTWYCCPSKTKL